jgi:diacylglycerol O-acyltransferase / wax synthase
VEFSPYGRMEKLAAIFPHPGSAKLVKSSGATLRHSMTGFQNLATAPNTISWPVRSPSSIQPGIDPSPITRRGNGGVGLPRSCAGNPRAHIDAAVSGVRTVSRSSSLATSNVVAGSAPTTTCWAIFTSNAGVADSISIFSASTTVMKGSSTGTATRPSAAGPSLWGLTSLPLRTRSEDSSVMEHLTTLDAGFLEAEDSDRHVSLAIGAISVIAGPMPDFESLVKGLADWILSVPRFRQVLRTYPLDLEAPYWVEDRNLDITHHVRRAALPRPGDDAALFRWVAEVMERRLDRDRPLWECWIVDGLPNNRWAMLMKIHHCIADGIAATHMLAALSDGGKGGTFATEIRAAHEPSGVGLHLPKFTLNPIDWISGAWRTSLDVTTAAKLALQGTVEIAGGLLRPASALTGPVTNMRRYATAETSLEDVIGVCDRFGVTVNDVALAAITDSFRASLIRRGKQPQRNSLRTLVPVSVRSNDAADKTDNRVSVMLPCLPVEQADPVEQLRTVHARLTRAKASGQRQAGSVFVAAANAIPFALSAWTVRALSRLPQRGVVTVATNVPGPRQRLHVMGREVIRLLPVPPIALQLQTGIAILSYADHLVFGIIGDYDASPDVDDLAQGVERGIARLVARAKEPAAAGGDS